MAQSDEAADSASAIISKILTQQNPWWWIGALFVVIGLPCLFWKLPETIKAISSYHDQHRKTSHKIQMDRDKLTRSILSRKPTGTGKKP